MKRPGNRRFRRLIVLLIVPPALWAASWVSIYFLMLLGPVAWFLAGALCMAAAVMSVSIRRNPPAPASTALPSEPQEAAAAQAHG